ncbi:hypothetical protein ACIPW5_37985 [Streptomyces sp. NPDC090077]|uniref:hypothetical protein n=1 Tax=Streptomyces sp. NPDC090077 TaxID=3365938 RepID=UPI0037F1A97F
MSTEADLLDTYLRDALDRLGPAAFETVIRAVDATCALLADGHPTILTGPDSEPFTPVLHREYLSLLTVLITGRTDHHMVALPNGDGTPGWAAVEPHLTHHPEALEDLCAQIITRAQEGARASEVLERAWRAG